MLLTFLILTLSSGFGAAAEIHVNLTDSIQAAINNANSGDVIIVKPGTYNENLDLSRSNLNNLVLRSESGNPLDTIITAKNAGNDVIFAKDKNNLVIKGFTISGAGTDKSGIYLLGSRNCTIENNIFLNDGYGFSLDTSSYIVVRNNQATKVHEIGTGRGIDIENSNYINVSDNSISNQRSGIYLTGSEGSTLSGNAISRNADHGIVLENSNSNVLGSNYINLNGKIGINLMSSGSNYLSSNTVSDGTNGINLIQSSGNVILSNAVGSTRERAIFLENSSDNNLQSNKVSSSPDGICLSYSDNNRLINNNAYNNVRGFYIAQSSARNTLLGNKANSNTNGIVLDSATNNVLNRNEANSNTNDAISLSYSSSNTVTSNNASQSTRGIYLGSSSAENTFSGNTVISNSDHGILLENSVNNTVAGNSVKLNYKNGIYLVNSSDSYLTSNSVLNNNRGIYLESSGKNKLSNNTISDNAEQGIMLSLSDYSTVFGNAVSKNNEGISLDSSENNNISSNTITWNSNYGIYLCTKSYGNLIYNNNLNNPVNAKVENTGNFWNITKTEGQNIIDGPYLGGNFWATPNGTGHSQITPDDNGDGITDSVYAGYNFTDNLPLIPIPDPIFPSANFKANVISGYAPLTVQFTDLSQNASFISWDVNSDKIEDYNSKNFIHVFEIPGTYTVNLTAGNKNGTDSKTLNITVQKALILPVPDLRASITSGYAPLSVQFTDLSQNSISRGWDIGNDGTVESTDENFVYLFTAPGKYTVKLIAANEEGIASKTVTITILENSGSSGGDIDDNGGGNEGDSGESSGDSGGSSDDDSGENNGSDGGESGDDSDENSGGGSGGSSEGDNSGDGGNNGGSSDDNSESGDGGSGESDGENSYSSSGGGRGGSPEPAGNIEVREISQAFVTNGKTAKFDFVKNATCVVCVSFDAKKTAGKTTTIAEQLKGKSTLVSNLSSGEVYKYFNLWVGNSGFATSSNIENPAVCFKVNKSWIQDKKIDPASITLNRYSDKKWAQLPVEMLKEDNRYMYFRAETPGFSFFAITGRIGDKEAITEVCTLSGIQSIEQNNTSSELENKTGPRIVRRSPGFEAICGIGCLLMVFLQRRKMRKMD